MLYPQESKIYCPTKKLRLLNIFYYVLKILYKCSKKKKKNDDDDQENELSDV